MNRWHREGYLAPGRWFSWHWTRGGEPAGSISVRTQLGAVVLSFRYRCYGSDEWKDVEQHVPLDWTPCHFGGQRPWFTCTAWRCGRVCGRRVGKLYLGGSPIFACRRCYNLAYASQQESYPGRQVLKAQKIRMRLGGDPSLLAAFPDKPPRMHWRTYNRLRERVQHAQMMADAALADWMSRLRAR